MLIINADDLGRSRDATDRILTCFKKGRITSASAMVFMADSERAAREVNKSGIDVGLHANFTETFTGNSVSAELRRQHERIRNFLRLSKYALLVYNPFLRKAFRDVFDAQYNEFTKLYGRRPTRVDGHQHMHLCTNILFDRVLPEGIKVRRNFSFGANEKNFVNRFYRVKVDRILARRHTLTNYFFALSQHLPTARLSRVLELATTANVELMTHPQVDAEYDCLMSDSYAQSISGTTMGDYRLL